VSDTEEFSHNFTGISPLPPSATREKLPVIRYKGKLEKPQWIDLEPGQRGRFTVTLRWLTHRFEQKTTRSRVISWWMRRKSLTSVSSLQLGSRALFKPMRLCTPTGRLNSRHNCAGRKGYVMNFVIFDRTTILMIYTYRAKRNGAPPLTHSDPPGVLTSFQE